MRQLFARLAGARAPWRYLFALVSGGLWALSFPQPGISILAWFAFVPLFVAAAPVPPKIAFRLGLVTGLAAYGTLLFGFTLVPARVGTSMAPADFLVGLALTGYLALYPAAVLGLTKRAERRRVPVLCSFPLLWVAGELIRSQLPGFPGVDLGYSQYRTLPLIQIADLTGVYGVSFLVAFANGVLYRMWIWSRGRERSYPVRPLIALLALICLTLGYGLERLTRPEQESLQRVLQVQGATPDTGAGRLVHLPGGAWSGSSFAPYQQLSQAVFCAVENRVPLLRPAHSGVAGVIDSKGHVRGLTQNFAGPPLTWQLCRGAGGTFYGRYGDLFALCCLGACLIILWRSFHRRWGTQPTEGDA